MRLRSLSLLITLLSWIPFTSADEVSLLERQAVLIAGKHDTDVLLVAQTGIYAIENTLTKRLAFGAIFALSPAPILSNDREYLASLAKKGGKSNLLHLYNLGWRREHIIQLPDTPTAWGWNPASSKIAIATGTGICELSIETDQIIPFPIQTQSPIHTLLYAPDEENLLAASNNEITLVNSQSKNITAVIPFPDAKSMSCSWVSNRHFALSIATHGPDSFVYLYEIDPSGALTIQPKQLAASGTVGEFQNVALLPFGKILAFGMEILSPSDFFDQNAPVTLSYIPHFPKLDVKPANRPPQKRTKPSPGRPKNFAMPLSPGRQTKTKKTRAGRYTPVAIQAPGKTNSPSPPSTPHKPPSPTFAGARTEKPSTPSPKIRANLSRYDRSQWINKQRETHAENSSPGLNTWGTSKGKPNQPTQSRVHHHHRLHHSPKVLRPGGINETQTTHGLAQNNP